MLHDHHVMNRVIEAMSDEIQEGCGELKEEVQFSKMSMSHLENEAKQTVDEQR